MRNTPQVRSAATIRATARPPLVIGCGALANELVELTRRAGLPTMDLTCLPASLHNRPEKIPAAVKARIRRARADGYDRIFVAYADCGTGGLLDTVLDAEGVARLGGAHCYEVYAGRAAFAALHDAEPGTFYLTDYLVRNFERLVVRGLGLDRHPELLPMYFGNYRRLVYLAQSDDPALTAMAEHAAAQLGDLAFERRLVGLGELATAVTAFGGESVATTHGGSQIRVEIRASGTALRRASRARVERPAVVPADGGSAAATRRSAGAAPATPEPAPTSANRQVERGAFETTAERLASPVAVSAIRRYERSAFQRARLGHRTQRSAFHRSAFPRTTSLHSAFQEPRA